MEDLKESVIFCQAPLKIAATLNCYKKEIAMNRRVVIVVMNAKNMYDFLKQLKLNAELLFFERPNNKGHRFLLYRRIKKKAVDNISKLNLLGYVLNKETNVFFTDICDNWEIGLYLKLLEKCKIYKIQDRLDIIRGIDVIDSDRKGVTLKMRLKEKLYYILYGFPWVYAKIDHWTLKVDLSCFNYPLLDFSDMNICNEYMISVPNKGKKTVLFFTEPYRNHFQSQEDYEKLNIVVVESLHKMGYRVGVKGHPRIGCNVNALKIADFEIPSYVPAEFLDLKCYDFVIGFVSSSLCSSSNQLKAYSILPMCQIQDKEEVDYWYSYLSKLSNDKVIFIDNFEKLN